MASQHPHRNLGDYLHPAKGRGVVAKPPLGSGSRFAAVDASAAKSGARNPRAVAAAIGMRKYGKARMEKLAKAGKKRSMASVMADHAKAGTFKKSRGKAPGPKSYGAGVD